MMKNEKGVTLIIVVITVIVLTIIAAVSITFSKDTINEVGNKKTMAELSNIQQAIFEQYVLLKSYGSEGQKPLTVATDDVFLEDDVDRPLELVGMRIVDDSSLNDYGFSTYKVTYTTDMPYENYYYLLTKADLANIGISDDSDGKDYTYIVNYSTGEVFDLVHTIYIDEYNSELTNAKLTGATNVLEDTEYNFTE